MTTLNEMGAAEMAEALLEHVLELSDWEEEFVEDIKEKLEREEDLSAKQSTKLEELYNKIFKD